MAKRKRASTRSRLLDRAVKAGRSAIHEAERRVPSDLRRQLERTIKDGQKTVQTTLKEVQAQVNRTAKQADLDKVLKRLDAVSKQVQEIARSASSRGAARPAPKPARRRPAARKPATRQTASRRTAAARRSSARRRGPAATPEVRSGPPPPAPDPAQQDVRTLSGRQFRDRADRRETVS